MPLDKPIETITEADLHALIDNREGEQKTIDYKRALNLDSDRAKDEFRADITSFANAIGGHYVVGIEESGGIATGLCGQNIENEEAFKSRIDEVLQTKVSPRVPFYRVKVISLTDGNGKSAAVIEVGRSFVKPHQIAVGKDDFQFWARNSAGKYRLTVDELRTIILRSDAVADHVRRFRAERIASVVADDTPVPLMKGAKIIFHLLPLSAFDPGTRYDLARFESNGLIRYAATMRDRGDPPAKYRHNMEGFVGYTKIIEAGVRTSYTQIYRNGIIESVDSDLFRYEQVWDASKEEALFRVLKRGLALQQLLGVAPPIAVMLSLVGAASCVIDRSRSDSGKSESVFGRDVMLIPEHLVDHFDAHPDGIMRNIFDDVWQAGDYPRCLRYDANGKYTPNVGY